MAASYRLAWATRSTENRLALALVAATGSFTFGLVHAASSGQVSPRLVYWSGGIVTAALIGIDFPGVGNIRWREFELSLPIAPLERGRAGLVLGLACWILPLLAVAALAQLGLFGAGGRLPLEALLVQLWSASASVLLAIALRHALGPRVAGWHTVVLRLAMVAAVVLGFFVPSAGMGAAALLAAVPMFAIAHREASRAPELRVPRGSASSDWSASIAATSDVSRSTASTHATLRGVALRYCLATFPAAVLLVAMLLWTFGGLAGWFGGAPIQVLFLPMWGAQYASWGARLLRLGHLPIVRVRLFRFLAWPILVALGLGIGLSLVWPPGEELCRIEQRDGVITLRAPQRLWRLTRGVPPVVTSPEGDSHRPRAHSFGLGSSLVAYDPYEVPARASRAFVAHQLGRLLADERGLSISAEQVEARYLPAEASWSRLSSDRFPELANPLSRRTRLAAGSLLIVLVLAAVRIPIRPGRALTGREWRRSPMAWGAMAIFLLWALYQVACGRSRDSADPLAIVVDQVSRQLGGHLWLVLGAALVAAVLLYRNLQRRFEQMEAPLRSKSRDGWFLEI